MTACDATRHLSSAYKSPALGCAVGGGRCCARSWPVTAAVVCFGRGVASTTAARVRRPPTRPARFAFVRRRAGRARRVAAERGKKGKTLETSVIGSD